MPLISVANDGCSGPCLRPDEILVENHYCHPIAWTCWRPTEKRDDLSLLLEVFKAFYFLKAVGVLKISNVGKVNSKFQCVKGMLTVNK